MIWELIGIVIFVYCAIWVFVFFFANSNILPNRRFKSYKLDIPAELIYVNSKYDLGKSIACWKAVQTEKSKNVVLLHGFTRTSGKMNRRAAIYWELGYNVYLIDNLGHGKSSHQLFPSGIRYGLETLNVILELNIKEPIIHGASMGGIASVVVSQKNPDIPKLIITEALPYNFDNLYSELLRYVGIPNQLFPGIEYISKKLVWSQIERLEIEYDVSEVEVPMFLIHSNSDRLFDYHDHYNKIIEIMDGKTDFEHWLVENASHTQMDKDPNYQVKLTRFISNYAN